MYCIQYDEICKKHNFELIHDTLGERVTLEYPADSVPKDTLEFSFPEAFLCDQWQKYLRLSCSAWC